MKSFLRIPALILLSGLAVGTYYMVDDLLIDPKIVSNEDTTMEKLPEENLTGTITKIEPTFGGVQTGVAFRQDGVNYDIYLTYSGSLEVIKGESVKIKKACDKYTVLETKTEGVLRPGDTWTKCSYIIGSGFWSVGKYGYIDSYNRVFPPAGVKSSSELGDNNPVPQCIMQGGAIIDCP